MTLLSTILLLLAFMNPASFQASKTSLFLSKRVVFSTKHSGVDRESHRIINAKEEAPFNGENEEIDFSKSLIFIAYLGQRSNGCYGIDVGKIEFVRDEGTKEKNEGKNDSQEAGSILSLEIIEQIPADDCLCPQVIVTPAIGILIPRIDERSIRIVKTKSILQCN